MLFTDMHTLAIEVDRESTPTNANARDVWFSFVSIRGSTVFVDYWNVSVNGLRNGLASFGHSSRFPTR